MADEDGGKVWERSGRPAWPSPPPVVANPDLPRFPARPREPARPPVRWRLRHRLAAALRTARRAVRVVRPARGAPVAATLSRPAAAGHLATIWRGPGRAGAEGAERTITPREACFVFGLGNMRPGAAERRRPDPLLADRLAAAQPQDCLDAAFALMSRRPSDVIGARLKGPVPPPFRDVDYFGAVARWLGCPFDTGALARQLGCGVPAVLVEGDGGVVIRSGDLIAAAPAAAWLPRLAALFARRPEARRRVVIVPPHAIAAGATANSPYVATGRLDPLHDVPPAELADRVVTRPQAILFVLALFAVTAAGLVVPQLAFGAVVLLMSIVLIGYAGSRAAPLLFATPPPPARKPLKGAELPEYSVLIPLYKEDEGVAHLVRALRRIDYPPDRLDIQFLVEADDVITQRAVLREATALPCRMTVVPPGLPRTKPRALNVGLRQARGSLVTIFDAEDRPDPRQLRVAAETFAAAGPEVAVLQARLTIDHLGDNWLTRMFALEYAALFDHVMPMVAGSGRLVLIGGTSNHFRTDALIEVGGWDPFNVTEDADLSVRLRRHGYRIRMIASETFEEAPLSIDAWLKQRSRWFKGYIQTWLVHHREPVRLVREIGIADALTFNVFVVGALAAALAHVLFIVQAVALLCGAPLLFGGPPALAVVQMLAVAVGYGTAIALGAESARRRKRARISPWAAATMPLYWVLMGIAVVIAIHDIIVKPHHWRKTTHGVAHRPARVAAS